jgi:hypothetical protein
MMSRVSENFGQGADDEDDDSGVFLWFLPILWFGVCVLVEWLVALFASPDASGVTGILVFTALMLLSLITALNTDNLSGAGRVAFFVYSVLGWMFGSVALMVLDAGFHHQAIS